MRSRWFHRPFFHGPHLGIEKRATWLELFYDLIFVASFIQLGNGLSSHVSLAGALAFAGVFVPLWVAWTGYTFFVNRYTVDDFVHRMLVFAQMFAVGGMALNAANVLDGDLVGFSLSAGAAQLIVAALHWRAQLQVSETRAYAGYWGLIFSLSGATWVASAWVEAPSTFAMWALATGVVLLAPLSRQSLSLNERFPIDFEHLGERYALLTLIVLGESFVKVLSALSTDGEGLAVYVQAGVLLSITCGLWWVYFDDVAGSHVRHGRGRWVIWLYAHLPVQIGITGVGVAIKKALHFTWDAPAPDKYRWMLAGFLALALLGVAAIDSVTERRTAEVSDRARVNVRWVSALVLLVLAPAGARMSGGLFLAIVTVLVVAQVVFDMMLAPWQESAEAEVGKRTMAEIVKTSGSKAARPTRALGTAVRKGAPSELRSDLYFYFMSGGWVRVFATLGFVFVALNVFFAALYTFEDGAVGNARGGSFADAFFFSVQTMSTVGFGALFPKSDYGNMVATVEVAVAMIGMAIVTGFIFAKASRPRASVLFSEPLVITKHQGKPTLVLRLGNARGNDVADATMDLVVLKDEISPEGAHLRRLHDVKLLRRRSPMFVLTWTAMHVIDESSPLWGVNWNDPGADVSSFIVTLVGHDGTYGQTIYARKLYDVDSIRVGHRFVDVLEQLEDGRMMIDYHRFHDTTVDPEVRRELLDPRLAPITDAGP
jgi:inward rectifier potassium channel